MENGMHLKRRSDCCRCDDVVHIYRQFDIEFVLFQKCSNFFVDNDIGGFGTGDDVCPYQIVS